MLLMKHSVYIQAIAIAGCFVSEGSILVVCPAILRFSWAEEIERWLPTCLPSDIHLGMRLITCLFRIIVIFIVIIISISRRLGGVLVGTLEALCEVQ